MDNEHLYRDLGEAATRTGLATVKWATLLDNARMFGFNGSKPLFDTLFGDASDDGSSAGSSEPLWTRPMQGTRILKEIYDKNNIGDRLSSILKKNE